MPNDPVRTGLDRLAVDDAAGWGARIAGIALEPGAGLSLRASRPGWRDVETPAGASRTLLAHPDAHPDDPMRTFRSDALRASVTLIARDGIIGACALHDDGHAAVCQDLVGRGWGAVVPA